MVVRIQKINCDKKDSKDEYSITRVTLPNDGLFNDVLTFRIAFTWPYHIYQWSMTNLLTFNLGFWCHTNRCMFVAKQFRGFVDGGS